MGVSGWEGISEGAVTNATLTNLNVTNNINTTAIATIPFVTVSAQLAGSTAAVQASLVNIRVTPDRLDSTNAANAPVDLFINHDYGGGAYAGDRGGMLIQFQQGGSIGSRGVIAQELWMFASRNNGGTDPATNPAGQIYCTNPQIVLVSGATSWYGAFPAEWNIAVQTGASLGYKSLCTFVNLSTDAVQGALYDTAIGFASQNPATAATKPIGWMNIISLGRADGAWPVDATAGTIWGTYLQSKNAQNDNGAVKPAAANKGIDFQNIAFVSSALQMPNGFTVSTLGGATIGTATLRPTTTGMCVDVSGNYVASVAIPANGSGSNYIVGEDVYDGLGGIYNVATVSAGGEINSLTIVNKAYVRAAIPANPVSLITGGSRGTGGKLTLTWTNATTLQLNPSGDTIIGKGVAIATAATSGYAVMPTCVGSPTGAPGNAGSMIYDTQGNRIWFYNGSWRSVAVA